MAITQRQVGSAVGTGAVGVVTAEAIQHGRESGAITRTQANGLTAGLAVGSAAIGGATLAGFLPLSPAAGASLLGFGLGTAAWGAGRDQGVLPRLSVGLPDEVNLTGPLVTAAVIGIVGLAVSTLADVTGADRLTPI